ncbi:WD40-repeat-containing domain protein [Cantharellus anzutake]|uniref:WD40-repeat-containing domain protein n=1 Tax=Cantharellus anzutake TaxID=1750568 RepID=UPI001907AA67|nr:WD40-repeat-containing domain protein [Cantharellus anzutake]KAF8314376.1 WD40-repeat-containing domain protein [Cantharellus anzutake]
MVVRSRAKVSRERIYSMAYHPEKTKDLIFVGDKHGQFGIWDALAPSEENEEDKYDDTREGGRYWRLQPHWPRSPKTSISCIKFSPTDAHSVFTTSYDSTLRVTSFTSGQSTELFSLASTSTLLTSFDIAPRGNEIWISDADGGLSFLDLREGSRSRRQVNAKLKIGCVSINPAAGRSHFICTASNDLSLKIWDVRKLMLIETGALVEGDDDGPSSLKVKPPPVLEADHEAVTDFLSSKPGRGCILGQFEHKYSVSSAFWDPRGRKIVTTCYDDNLRIWNLDAWLSSGEKLKFPRPIQKAHNCQTGRWLTVLKAQWSQNPNEPSHFTVGSMDQSLDVIAYNGEEIVRLADRSKVTAVQAVTASHPCIAERAVSGNASGRCILWGPPED